MRGQPGLRHSLRILARVFLFPADCNEAAARVSQWTRIRNDSPRRTPIGSRGRCFSNSPSLARRRDGDLEEKAAAMDAEERIDRRYTLKDYMEKTGRDRLPRDHEITDPQILVLDGGSIEGPLSTRFVMTKLTSGESLRMVQPYTPPNPKEGKPASYALCKIVNIQDEYKAEKERKEKKKQTAKPKTKEVELSWGISEHDLITKTRQMGGFLEKGLKVEVVLGKKKGGRNVSEKDAQELLKRIRQEVEARNAMESKPVQGEVGGVMRLALESKEKKKK